MQNKVKFEEDSTKQMILKDSPKRTEIKNLRNRRVKSTKARQSLEARAFLARA